MMKRFFQLVCLVLFSITSFAGTISVPASPMSFVGYTYATFSTTFSVTPTEAGALSVTSSNPLFYPTCDDAGNVRLDFLANAEADTYKTTLVFSGTNADEVALNVELDYKETVVLTCSSNMLNVSATNYSPQAWIFFNSQTSCLFRFSKLYLSSTSELATATDILPHITLIDLDTQEQLQSHFVNSDLSVGETYFDLSLMGIKYYLDHGHLYQLRIDNSDGTFVNESGVPYRSRTFNFYYNYFNTEYPIILRPICARPNGVFLRWLYISSSVASAVENSGVERAQKKRSNESDWETDYFARRGSNGKIHAVGTNGPTSGNTYDFFLFGQPTSSGTQYNSQVAQAYIPSFDNYKNGDLKFFADEAHTKQIDSILVVDNNPMRVYFTAQHICSCSNSINFTYSGDCYKMLEHKIDYDYTNHTAEGYLIIQATCDTPADGTVTMHYLQNDNTISSINYTTLRLATTNVLEVVEWFKTGFRIESYVHPFTEDITLDSQLGTSATCTKQDDGTYLISGVTATTMNNLANSDITIKWGNQISTIRVPVIIQATYNSTEKQWKQSYNASAQTNLNSTSDVVIRTNPSGDKATQLLINEDFTCRNMYIYEKCEVTVNGSYSFNANELHFFSYGDTRTRMPRFNSFNASAINILNIYRDIRIDEDRYYWFALPFDVSTSDIEYACNAANGGKPKYYSNSNGPRTFYIMYYDGSARAVADMATRHTQYSKHVAASGGEAILRSGQGYVLGIPDQFASTGHKYRTLRFPAVFIASDWATEKDGSKVLNNVYNPDDNPSARPIHQGWNLIGSPFMRGLNTTANTGLFTGMWIKELDDNGDWTGLYVHDKGETAANRYASFYNAGSQTYTQTALSNCPIYPFEAFFVQVKSGNSINFKANTIGSATITPELLSKKRRAADEIHTLSVGISLKDIETDPITILIDEEYTNDYDYADLAKLRNGSKTNIWALDENEDEMRYLSIPDVLHQIPLGMYSDKSQSYTFTLDSLTDADQYESVTLFDAELNMSTNLCEKEYAVQLNKGYVNNRFYLQIKPKTQTSIVTQVEEQLCGVRIANDKNIVQLSNLPVNSRVWLYDATGKLIDYYQSDSATHWNTVVPATGVYYARIHTMTDQFTLKTIVK